MSLRKWCECATSPDCDHPWFYDFRIDRRRYRESTKTANKQQAKQIEARERSNVVDGRHEIRRRQPDVTFATFAAIYLRDHADVHHQQPARTHEIVKVLIRAFGTTMLRELTTHQIEQFQRERLRGEYRPAGQSGALKPATVNRELTALRGILTKAIGWKRLREHPMTGMRPLKVQNSRTRILTDDEQKALIAACPRKLSLMVRLALITGARIGELLGLTWPDVGTHELTFLQTKNGTSRRLPLSDRIRAVLADCRRPGVETGPVFRCVRSKGAYTVNGVRCTFRRAVARAGIKSGDVTLHTLRHTAISRMIASGMDMFTVMDISGHSSPQMLRRYTHPTDDRKLAALDTFKLDGQKNGQRARRLRLVAS